MHLVLKTLLNHVERLKGFVYESSRLVDQPCTRTHIEIRLRARERSGGACGHCQKLSPGYDHLPERQFQFVPLWGIPTFFRYAPRRVRRTEHGIVVEHLPWALGKRPLTASFAWFLASWAKLLAWQDVSRTVKTSWESVFRSVEMAVDWGRARMDLTGISAAGVDEIHWRKGRFLTRVYQINEGMKRLLFVAENREETSLRTFFLWLGPERSAQIRFICSDMWQPIAERATGALNILDRYHIAAKMNKAIDEVRAKQTREVRSRNRLSKSSVALRHSRWCLLKRVENLTAKQAVKLQELLACSLRTVRSYLLKEQFHFFWEYASAAWAGKFLEQWCTAAMRSRLEPMKKVARMLRDHKPLILNWFEAREQVSLGAAEGLNNRLKANLRKSYGFRTYKAMKVFLYHKLGAPPAPDLAHRFC
jgi:transposase